MHWTDTDDLIWALESRVTTGNEAVLFALMPDPGRDEREPQAQSSRLDDES